MITTKKWGQLRHLMQRFHIHENDVEEKFIVGSGHGGQKLQKTSSTVFIKHIPTRIQVKCQHTRFRDDNRYIARKILCEKIEHILLKEKSAKQQLIHKFKKQKKRRSKKAKQKMLEQKHKRSAQKTLRKKLHLVDD